MKTILVTDQVGKWDFAGDISEVVPAIEYLTNERYINHSKLRVINLCKGYQYHSIGYYVSLLAQARRHKVIPSVLSIHDVDNPSIADLAADSLSEDIEKSLKHIKSDEFILSVYFGKNIAKSYQTLCYKLYGLFPLPLFQVKFKRKNEKWSIKKLQPINISKIPESHSDFLQDAALEYFNKKRYKAYNNKKYKYSMAILHNPLEKTPPSNEAALKKFIKAGEDVGINCELIQKEDYKFIAEYDALFIRETTFVNHHTYKFSRRAHSEGLVVLDDPESILKCTNKVYLTELLCSNNVPYPKTFIVTKHNWKVISDEIPKPCVIKVPDSAFSLGVVKANDDYEVKKYLSEFFQKSELVIVQAYMPTEYDWRIGILNQKPIYACKYFMAKDHWQIVNWKNDRDEGEASTVSIDEVPQIVLTKALKAAKLIGKGLYGVDLKQIGNSVYVIEVNDNPNIDHGVEDAHSGDLLYKQIMQYFVEKLNYAS